MLTSWLTSTRFSLAAIARTIGSPRPSSGTSSARLKSISGIAPDEPSQDGAFQIGVGQEPSDHLCSAKRRLRASSIRCCTSTLRGRALRSRSAHLPFKSRKYASDCSGWFKKKATAP